MTINDRGRRESNRTPRTTLDIVFIHGNYPAQFRHLAAALGSSKTHRVIFLTAREDAACQPIKGVETRQLAMHRKPSAATHHYLITTEEAVLKGQAVLRALNELVEEGISPRLVITHAGMGLGLFVKELLPQAVHIGLFEWFFKPETARWLMASFEFNVQLQTKMRNLPILDELNSCDIGVVPTAWQKRQFPKEFHKKLHVIFDGIDMDFFCPNPSIDQHSIFLEGEELTAPLEIEPDQPLLSYATRGMETLRGFPEFLKAAAYSLEEIPNLQVVIAGRDRCAYSYEAPTNKGSWKAKILEELGNFPGKERLHFTGLMPYIHYKQLLQRSNLHCYFTRPYVTSWSLFEAAACGARLCVNQSPATEGIIDNPESITWVDLDNQTALNHAIVSKLQNHVDKQRSALRADFDLPNSLNQWQNLVNHCLTHNS